MDIEEPPDNVMANKLANRCLAKLALDVNWLLFEVVTANALAGECWCLQRSTGASDSLEKEAFQGLRLAG